MIVRKKVAKSKDHSLIQAFVLCYKQLAPLDRNTLKKQLREKNSVKVIDLIEQQITGEIEIVDPANDIEMQALSWYLFGKKYT